MKNDHPFITIGIASYNYARFLPQAFEAIKRQSFRDFEVLYADDGSKDDSVDVINGLIRDNPDMSVRLITGGNLGVMGNKQRLLDNARGEYIMLCDADDWMDDDCLETLAAAARENDADRVVSEIRNVDPDGKLLYVQSFPDHPSKWCEVLHHGALYRMSVIRNNGVRMPDRIPDDFCFVEGFNIHASQTAFVKRSVYNWRVHAESTSNKNTTGNAWKGEKILTGVLEQSDALKPFITAQEDRELLQAECVKYYCFHLFRCANYLNQAGCMATYRTMRDLMRRYEPGYLENRYMKLREPGPFRESVHRVLWAFILCEKLHVMPLVLSVLRLAAKVRPI